MTALLLLTACLPCADVVPPGCEGDACKHISRTPVISACYPLDAWQDADADGVVLFYRYEGDGSWSHRLIATAYWAVNPETVWAIQPGLVIVPKKIDVDDIPIVGMPVPLHRYIPPRLPGEVVHVALMVYNEHGWRLPTHECGAADVVGCEVTGIEGCWVRICWPGGIWDNGEVVTCEP